MPAYVKSQHSVGAFCVDCCINALCPFIKQCQYCLIHIIVYEYDTLLCTPDQITYKYIGIEYLSVKKDSFFRRQRCMKKKTTLSDNSFS